MLGSKNKIILILISIIIFSTIFLYGRAKVRNARVKYIKVINTNIEGYLK